MSSDINPDVPPRIRCEAISPPSTSQNVTCHRLHGNIRHYPRSGAGHPTADDPARLIGLALGHVRQGEGLNGLVPDMIISRLQAHADTGNPACRLLLDWLDHRNSDLLAASLSPITPARATPLPNPAPAAASEPEIANAPKNGKRRLIRERRQAVAGSLKKRRPTKVHSTDCKTAIIAAQTEGKADE